MKVLIYQKAGEWVYDTGTILYPRDEAYLNNLALVTREAYLMDALVVEIPDPSELAKEQGL